MTGIVRFTGDPFIDTLLLVFVLVVVIVIVHFIYRVAVGDIDRKGR